MAKEFLIFCERAGDNSYMVKNNRGQFLGDIYHKKVGRKSQWVFECDSVSPFEENSIWLTSECLNQISEKLDSLLVGSHG